MVYQGDDERFDYVYRFVTRGSVNTSDRSANLNLLDEGTLYVAKYNADGTGEWLPLVYGEGPLTDGNGFRSQADVVIEARRAGDLVGATKMDRPEGTEVNAKTHKVYVMLTNNTRRKPDQIDAANPRAENAFGHIIEMVPEADDHAGAKFKWEILVRCGDPSVAAVGATFSTATTKKWLVWYARHGVSRRLGKAVDWYRWAVGEVCGAHRWPLRAGDRGRLARHLKIILPLPSGCRTLRTRANARRRDFFHRDPTSRRGWRGLESVWPSLDLRRSGQSLARLQSCPTATPFDRGDH